MVIVVWIGPDQIDYHEANSKDRNVLFSILALLSLSVCRTMRWLTRSGLPLRGTPSVHLSSLFKGHAQ